MSKKKTPQTESEKAFSSGEVMSLLEHMSGGIEIIAEAQGETNQRLDRIETRLDEHDDRFDRLEMRFDGLETRFDGLETRFDGLEQKVDRLQEDMTEVKYKLSEKVDVADFKKLEKRMVKIEKLVFAKLH